MLIYLRGLLFSLTSGQKYIWIDPDGIIKLYGDEYLCKPTTNGIQHSYDAHESKHGISIIFSSIDYTH